MSNTGAVAGVFTVVGIVVASVVAIVSVILCRRRRRRRIRTSISRPLPYPQNPFEDPRDSPSPTRMRYASGSSDRNIVGTGLGSQRVIIRSLLDEDLEPVSVPVMAHASRNASASDAASIGLAGVGAGTRSVGRPAYDAGNPSSPTFSPYSPYATFTPSHRTQRSDGSGSIGVAISNDAIQTTLPTPRHLKRTSETPSTPSVYPATLPGEEEDSTQSSHVPLTPATGENVPTFGAEKGAVPLAPPPVRPPRRRPVPQLPPRNPLRTAPETAKQLLVRTQLTPRDANIIDMQKPYEPLTPPATATSESDGSSPIRPSPTHSPSSSVSNPFADYNKYMSVVATEARPRDNFYTRRKVVGNYGDEVRLSS